jgi:two-component system LytT family response regulator
MTTLNVYAGERIAPASPELPFPLAPAKARPAMSVLVAGAEEGARAHLCSFLRRLSGVERVLECDNGREAVEVIRAQQAEVAFLEVRLPGLGGFEVVERVSPGRVPAVVLVAECREYASKAFEIDAVDYLVRPFDEGRCLAAVDRARRRLEASATAVMNRIPLKLRGRAVILPVEDIDWLEARDNYVRLHVGGAKYLVRGKISALEAGLDPRRFIRVHRRALVNVERIVEVRSGPRAEVVVLRTGIQLPVGSTRRNDLLQRLGLSPGA